MIFIPTIPVLPTVSASLDMAWGGCVSVFRRNTAQGKKIFEAWSSEDRDFLRKLLEVFQNLACRGKLKLSALCTHPRGQGGVKRALGEVDAALRSGEFTPVCRSDAKSYYASIRHDILLQQLGKLPLPAGLQKAVAAYCQRTLHYGGLYATSSRGISQGGSLSPLLGAIYLTPLDEAMAALPGIFYRRYMDDWVILAKSRWALRRAVRRMNEVLTMLDLRQHPDKTWIGRIAPGEANDSQEKTFDFLGMDFSHQGLCGLSAATAERVKEVTAQVYDRTVREARQGKTKSPGQVAAPLASQAEFLRRVETYRTHWQRYLKGILAGFHHHLGAAAAQELYQRLCAQHRQLSSTDHWLNHFPLSRWQGKSDTKTHKIYVRKIQEDGLGGCYMHAAGC